MGRYCKYCDRITDELDWVEDWKMIDGKRRLVWSGCFVCWLARRELLKARGEGVV